MATVARLNPPWPALSRVEARDLETRNQRVQMRRICPIGAVATVKRTSRPTGLVSPSPRGPGPPSKQAIEKYSLLTSTSVSYVPEVPFSRLTPTSRFFDADVNIGYRPPRPRGESKRVTETSNINAEARMLIDGRLVEAESGKTFENINPATEEVLGLVADGSAGDMSKAITAARRAFDETDWSTNRALRKRCLTQLQEALESEKEELREELISEVGCPRMVTYGPQLDAPLQSALRYPVQLIDEFAWETELPDALDMRGNLNARRVWKEPVGVVGAIVPWNYPIEVTLNKLGQALATGNTVVLKPAPDTPWNATRIGRLVAERTDIPDGVMNVVTSSDHLVGEELTVSPLVDLISFTGSTAVGKRIIEKGAPTVKRLFLELGGKSPTIVLDDADFPTALLSGLAVCYHAGQGCAIQTRMLLPQSRYAEGVEILKSAMGAVPYGDPQRPDVIMGPLISEKQRTRVLGYIEKGVAEGAELAIGGSRPGHLDKGWYVEPTLFTDVDNSMAIAQEEIFGPVLVVIAFEDDDDAVRIANDSVYGLAGGVFSGSFDRAISVARRVRTGVMSVNGGAPYGPDVPFGGYKYSGIGRQNGTNGFEQYLETKAVGWPTL
jgi:aldehyde dehydrogenase (NAD+)